MAENQLTLRPRESSDLVPGDEIQLVFLLDDARFKAPTRILETGSGWIRVRLPAALHPAERRNMARGYLNAREGAAAMAFAGLFSPLAASSSSTSMGSLHALVDEAATRPATWEGGHGAPPSASAGDGEAWPPPGLRTGQAAPSGATFWTSYVVDWLRARRITLNSSCTSSVVEQSVRLATGEFPGRAHDRPLLQFTERNPFLGQGPAARRLGRDAFAHGVTYTFMSRGLPATWHRVLPMASVRFEAYCAGNDLRLGIRVK